MRVCALLLAAVLFALAAPAKAQGLIVDHHSIAQVPNLPQETLDRVNGELSFFFAHASVGGNILKGIKSLQTASPARYKLVVARGEAAPPDATVKGRIYDFNRGNPGWKKKVDGFKTAMDSGWAGKVDVVLNKFCYVDPGATLEYYAIANAQRSAMSQLEADYPGAKFVYMTIPLKADAQNDNVVRNAFNAALRAWAREHNKILFDIADIQSHDEDGTPNTFVSGGKTYFGLCPRYTNDGGHLNALGSERVALGFYALGAALLASD